MTTSICIRCGAAKVGAFSPCAACQYDPARETDRRTQARCLWLSDHYHSAEALEALAARIRRHEPVAFDEKMVDSLVGQLGTQQMPALVVAASGGFSLWALALMGLAVGIGVGVAALVLFLLER